MNHFKIPGNLDDYTEAGRKALEDAKAAVVRGKNITEQPEVDAMAKVIEDAIAGLEKKKAAIVNKDKPKGNNTKDDSVKTSTEKVNAVKTGDYDNLLLWGMLLIISGLGSAKLMRFRRHN